ncbi:type II toxin-antitoxin system VapB family antitoxin [Rhizobium sp. ICMP 5592]|uniref:type II toxin-antitoxin system VapB family antitoxin n=1 Tax=Rhizobium sp. ICMP 5592 TaxID=2292445 RepID=UPI00129682B8|nr:type II toxin-antitoxin system VapB family antitoxin [Rhizobium sp. ICMP 5592]MQB43705.1 type II toxin-antitoxin system VapB family antitoxin [Rhizobium sp. ICMP 5592]
MRTTVTIDDKLLADAREVTGLAETSAIVREALKALVEYDAARILIRLGGTEPNIAAPLRHRSDVE